MDDKEHQQRDAAGKHWSGRLHFPFVFELELMQANVWFGKDLPKFPNEERHNACDSRRHEHGNQPVDAAHRQEGKKEYHR